MVEVHFPILAIIVACLDRKVRIIKLDTKQCLDELSEVHKLGVRQLDYTPFHGGALLSVGYEIEFNVWQMDRTQSFPKTSSKPIKLNNISASAAPVVGARFLEDTFFCASIDSLCSLKIWDFTK